MVIWWCLQTPNGPAIVVGLAKGSIWFHVIGESGASYWSTCKTAEDFQKKGFSVLEDIPVCVWSCSLACVFVSVWTCMCMYLHVYICVCVCVYVCFSLGQPSLSVLLCLDSAASPGGDDGWRRGFLLFFRESCFIGC